MDSAVAAAMQRWLESKFVDEGIVAARRRRLDTGKDEVIIRRNLVAVVRSAVGDAAEKLFPCDIKTQRDFKRDFLKSTSRTWPLINGSYPSDLVTEVRAWVGAVNSVRAKGQGPVFASASDPYVVTLSETILRRLYKGCGRGSSALQELWSEFYIEELADLAEVSVSDELQFDARAERKFELWLHDMISESHLGASNKTGSPRDLDRFIESARSVTSKEVGSRSFNVRRSSTLANALLRRHQATGNPSDLDESIALGRATVKQVGEADPYYALYVSNLAAALVSRFELKGDARDLESAIELLALRIRNSAELHAYNPAYFINFSTALVHRFRILRREGDLLQAIDHCLQYIAIVENQQGDATPALQMLQEITILADQELEPASLFLILTESVYEPIRDVSSQFSERTKLLLLIGAALSAKFSRTGEERYLNKSLEILSESSKDVSPEDSNYPLHRAAVGEALIQYYVHTGDGRHLEEAISTLERAIELCAPNPTVVSPILETMAVALLSRFEGTGNISDLDGSILYARRALQTDDKPSATMLMHLSGALRRRFECTSNGADLDEAVSLAVQATEEGSSDSESQRLRLHTNLGTALYSRFSRSADPSDLNRAISLLRNATSVSGGVGSDGETLYSNLAGALSQRFLLSGNQDDIDEAVEVGLRSIQRESSHPSYCGRLTNVSTIAMQRYLRSRIMEDIDLAIALGRRAVDSSALEHPERSKFLSNLSACLRIKFVDFDVHADLDESIKLSREACDNFRGSIHERSMYFANLAMALLYRSEHFPQSDDLVEAERYSRLAIEAASDHGSIGSEVYSVLGNCLSRRFDLFEAPPDLYAAAQAFLKSAENAYGTVGTRIKAYQRAADCLLKLLHLDPQRQGYEDSRAVSAPTLMHTLLETYMSALNLVPQLLWRGLRHSDQQILISEVATSLGRDAAACAIALGKHELAVELVERGRGMFWQQLIEFHSDEIELRREYPDIADRLEQLRAKLDVLARVGDPFGTKTRVGSLNQDRLQVSREYESLVEEIRRLPATELFPEPERFLSASHSFNIHEARACDTIVILNVSKIQCDAIIVQGSEIKSVPLPTDYSRVVAHCSKYLEALDRFQGSANQFSLEMASRFVVEWLWNEIAGPVLNCLGLEPGVPGDRAQPRIWWCPTGLLSLIPIHAAGFHYAEDDRTVIGCVVSSYLPTLWASTKRSMRKVNLRSSRMLSVAISATPHHGPPELGQYLSLPGTRLEQRMIIDLLGESSVTALTDETATSEDILNNLGTHLWVHVGCHGFQDLEEPWNGGLVPFDWMNNGIVRLTDMIGRSATNGELVFLSACKTAVGGVGNADEAVSLSAALYCMGWDHVVGSLWTVDDDTATVVSESFYRSLQRGDSLDVTVSAVALHNAVLELRSQNPGNISSWARFVHFGT
jgi:tetratricopeptide (TPR) repeat protein